MEKNKAGKGHGDRTPLILNKAVRKGLDERGGREPAGSLEEEHGGRGD